MSARLKALQEKREKLVADGRAALDEIGSNTDDSRAAELEQRHDTIMTEYDQIEKDLAREERMSRIEKDAEQRRAGKRPIGPDTEARGQDEGEALEYRGVFHKMLAAGGDLSELDKEERALLKSGLVKIDKEERMQTAGTTTAGGYTVPTELAGFIDKAMKDWGPMYDEDICTVVSTTSGNPIKIPTVDDTAKSAGTHTEGTQLTDDGSEDVTFGQKSLDAYIADTEWIKWSFELNQDSYFAIETLLGALLGERLGRKGNAWLTVGTGSSQPQGIVPAAGLGKTAASATAIAADELIDLQHSVNAAYRRSPKCRWMFADSTLQAIRKLKDGQGNYLFQMGDIRVGAPDTLLGKPFSINDDVPAIATGNRSAVFGDFSRYYVRRVGAPLIGVVRERFWPDLGIAGLIRLDGEIGQSGAIKALVQA
ncbi:phage major capsid protein [Sphingomonas bisphenolicum]|uniref:Phage capsid protein n=1 Tax=Sphingomonas bisphenolicum TaxID=296544 RepID=A0ABN5WD25_9SPHN|nr:phage major capsid protein [Sphingomonas bisphenolicum]BBF70196.1 phage capsid protein [Sphingomonas bisphenolicum]